MPLDSSGSLRTRDRDEVVLVERAEEHLPASRVVERRSELIDAERSVLLLADVRGLPTDATVRWREEGGLITTWTVHDAATLATARAHADGLIFEHVTP